jgi:hypothetical protein
MKEEKMGLTVISHLFFAKGDLPMVDTGKSPLFILSWGAGVSGTALVY